MINDKTKLETDQVHLKQIQTTGHANFVKVKENILIQEKALNDAVRNYAGRLTEKLDKHLKAIYASTDGEMNSISISMTKIDEKSKVFENLINMTDVAKFFTEVDKFQKFIDVPVLVTKSIFPSMPLFVQGTITQFNFGTLVHMKNHEGDSNVTITVDTEYNTELSRVGSLLACSDGSLWITNNSDDILQKVKPEGTNLSGVASFNIKVFAMALIKSDDLLLKVCGENRFQQVDSTTGHMSDSVYDVNAFNIIAIHVTSDNNVIVGGFKGSVGAVIVMNIKGHHERVYEHDQHQQPISTYPRSITTTMNGNIHVVDFNPDNESGRIVVLGQNGDIINVYSGQTDINNDEQFKPVDIATTPRDNIIVVDMNTHTLHIMNNTGHLLAHFNTKGIGIIYPKSLTFTHTGEMYIGCTRKANSKTKEAKLYKVNMSGC